MTQPDAGSMKVVVVSLVAAVILLIGGPLGLYYQTRPGVYQPGTHEDIAGTITGVWVWEGDACGDSPQHISFNADLSEMYLVRADYDQDGDSIASVETIYRVVEFLPYGVRGAIIGEGRLTAAGEPVVWDLVLRDADTFVWRRTDLPPNNTSRENLRCSDEVLRGSPLDRVFD
jgi:hypothetical protein